jgi:hypothetical protein
MWFFFFLYFFYYFILLNILLIFKTSIDLEANVDPDARVGTYSYIFNRFLIVFSFCFALSYCCLIISDGEIPHVEIPEAGDTILVHSFIYFSFFFFMLFQAFCSSSSS